MSNVNVPLIENQNFEEILKNIDVSDDNKNTIRRFYNDGYLVVDTKLDDLLITNILKDLNEIVEKKNYKTNFSAYHYNDSPRIVEAWKESKNIKKLALNNKIISTLKLLYQRSPIPFSTINFIKGTSQPMHSDNIHFDTLPPRWLAGVWVALEDTDSSNGPLTIFPESHKLKTTTLKDLNLPIANRDNLKEVYSKYEEGIKNIILENNLSSKEMTIKKGEAIIWSANLLHGGKLIKDSNRTRFSQVTHYHFEGCEKFFNPLYSEPHNGIYKERYLEEIKNN